MEQYYGELYIGLPGQDEQHIGYIESWLIQKPTAQRPNRSNEWVREWLDPNGDIPEGTELFETAHMLRTLFAENGEVQPYFVMSSPKLPRDVGTSPLRDDLGPQGTELVYISTIWIDEVVRTLLSMC